MHLSCCATDASGRTPIILQTLIALCCIERACHPARQLHCTLQLTHGKCTRPSHILGIVWSKHCPYPSLTQGCIPGAVVKATLQAPHAHPRQGAGCAQQTVGIQAGSKRAARQVREANCCQHHILQLSPAIPAGRPSQHRVLQSSSGSRLLPHAHQHYSAHCSSVLEAGSALCPAAGSEDWPVSRGAASIILFSCFMLTPAGCAQDAARGQPLWTKS